MSITPRAGEETGAELVRGVVLIVAAGLALGIAFNALQRSAGPDRGLTWIRRDVTLANLEDLPPGPPRTPADSGAAGTGDPPTDGGGEPPAAAPGAVAAIGAPSSPSPAATTPAPPRPAPAAPREDLPAIPESGQPLEAQYATVKKLFDARAAVFVDARSSEEYEQGHIPGALHLDFDEVFEDPGLASRFDSRGKPIVAYCGGGECELSQNLAFALIEGGHRKVLVFKGGIETWTAEGQPLVPGVAPGGDSP